MSADAITAALGLSVAEGRLASALCAGQTLEQYAGMAELSRNKRTDLVRELGPARGHPEWERGKGAGASDADRQELESILARRLDERFSQGEESARPLA